MYDQHSSVVNRSFGNWIVKGYATDMWKQIPGKGPREGSIISVLNEVLRTLAGMKSGTGIKGTAWYCGGVGGRCSASLILKNGFNGIFLSGIF